MKSIEVCMGDACHLKGAPLLVQGLIQQLKKQNVQQVEVTVIGAVCQSQCSEAIVVKINGITYTHITMADIPRLVTLCLREEEL